MTDALTKYAEVVAIQTKKLLWWQLKSLDDIQILFIYLNILMMFNKIIIQWFWVNVTAEPLISLIHLQLIIFGVGDKCLKRLCNLCPCFVTNYCCFTFIQILSWGFKKLVNLPENDEKILSPILTLVKTMVLNRWNNF